MADIKRTSWNASDNGKKLKFSFDSYLPLAKVRNDTEEDSPDQYVTTDTKVLLHIKTSYIKFYAIYNNLR